MQNIKEAETEIADLDRQRFTLIDSIADLTSLRDTSRAKRGPGATDSPAESARAASVAEGTASPRRSKTAELIARADGLIKAHARGSEQDGAPRSPRITGK